MHSRSRARLITISVGALTAVALACAAATPALAADSNFEAKVPTWGEAASALGTAGSLWQPGYTARLKQSGDIWVLANNLTFSNGTVTSGETNASGQYGTNKRGFRLYEKWANTGWAADPAPSWQTARVGTVKITLGPKGTSVTVPATVSANCYRAKPDKNFNIPEQPKGFHCSTSDVLRYGGILQMTAKPPSQMTAPGNTTIRIETAGLTYDQLVSIASSLTQAAAGMDNATGSAQMRALCQQMVDGKMTPAQADALAKANSYSTRVGTVDGVPQAVTMDFRTDRFTLSVTKNAVVSCTYG